MATRTFTEVTPSQTAATVGSYVPPFATAGGRPAPSQTTLAHNPNPTTPSFLDDSQWAFSYLLIHKMSDPSYRYAYMFWFVVSFGTLVAAILHGTGSTGGAFGAAWNKFALRRRTWRKRHSIKQAQLAGQPHKQPFSFAPNAQLLALTFLFVITMVASLVGPDYIAPGTHVWDLVHNVTRRDTSPIASTPTTRQPDYTISKAWWTVGGRTGIIAFALFPLCILFSLKAPPFAVFAISFLTQIHFDKLARLHIWTGRLIWFITTIHVATWGVQLGRDARGGGTTKVAWNVVWLYPPFIYGCIAYITLTLVVILSITSIRTRYYEHFYVLHIIFVPLTLVFSGLHFPTIGWWCWSGLALWGAERIWRIWHWYYVNGYIFAPPINRRLRVDPYQGKSEAWEMGVRPPSRARGATDGSQPTSRGSFERQRSGDLYDKSEYSPNPHKRDTWGSAGSELALARQYSHTPPPFLPTNIPPAGWAHATLLPGRTVRLRLLTPRPVRWAPGQHVLLRIPSVSRYTTHPFTIASVCDNDTLDGHLIELLVRARGGFTRRLWDQTLRLSSSSGGDFNNQEKPELAPQRPSRGAFLKAQVDGPFGSSVRARWGAHSSIVIITGGSGVSFGASILEYVCLCISGRDGKELGSVAGGWGHGDFRTTRVRFVWAVREYSHIQWCASIIRRCLQMVPSSILQVDIFVSNFNHKRASSALSYPGDRGSMVDDDVFVPPTPHFFRQGRPRSNSNSSVESLASTLNTTNNSYVDLDYSHGGRTPADSVTLTTSQILGHEEHVLDLTNFDGEDDVGTAGEAQLSLRVKKEGKLRRAKSRKAATASMAKMELQRVAEGKSGPPKGAYDPFGAPYTASPSGAPVTSADPYRTSMMNPDFLGAYESQPEYGVPTGRLVSPTPMTAMTGWNQYPTGRDDHSAPPSSFPRSPRGEKRFSQASIDRGLSPSPSNLEDVMSPHGAESIRRLVSPGPGAAPYSGGNQGGNDSKRDPGADDLILNLDDDEAEDLSFASEMARPGKPKLDRIIADEVERSRGAVAVACCGPTSLNAVVRKIVAAQINPSRILSGDMRGSINLITEEFEW